MSLAMLRNLLIPSNVWFVWDPYEKSFELYNSELDAHNAAEAIIQVARGFAFQEGTWPEWTSDICIGKLTMEARSFDGDCEDTNMIDYRLVKARW